MRLTASVLLVAVAIANAAYVERDTPTLKERVNVPRGWTARSRAPLDHIIRLRIGLQQPRIEELEETLMRVSDPHHEDYGKHLTKSEVEELAAPLAESLDAVDAWLSEHNIDLSSIERSDAKDWVNIRVTVEQAERMLNTEYRIYDHAASGESIVRTEAYYLPKSLHGHIDVVQPSTAFARLNAMAKTSFFEPLSVLKAATTEANYTYATYNITLPQLQRLYRTDGYKAKGKGEVGIAGYLEEFANFQDLKSFYAKYLPKAVNTTLKVVSINGGQNDQDIALSGVEAALDVQWAGGISYPIPNTYYTTGGRPPFNPSASTPTNTNEPYADWLEYMLALKKPPTVVTTSYGDDEQTVPKSYAERVCRGFAQLGARGVSLTFSSGDGGVGDGESDPTLSTDCVSNDGKNTKKFLPIFPGGCPYVTAVGGTYGINPEIVVPFSGGGFSNYFESPSYQKAAVSTYLAKHVGSKYKGLYNKNGRGYPDVAAQGLRFHTFFRGKEGLVSGTSASSPAFAGVIALVNDARLSKGLPPLGFLNPWIYSIGRLGLNDITSGSNPGCGTIGFNATSGWDPVTGYGTPDFVKLRKLAGA